MVLIKMILAIVGYRHYNNYHEFKTLVFDFWNRNNYTKIISGGASGTDSLAERFAVEYNIPFDKTKYLPQWSIHGRAAGPIRNRLIVQDADAIIIFLSVKSKGSKNVIQLCQNLSKPYSIVHINE